MNNALSKFSALLHEKWVEGTEPDAIVGRWAEDNSMYTVTVPHQLRESLIQLQNHLVDKNNDLVRIKQKAAQLEREAKDFFDRV